MFDRIISKGFLCNRVSDTAGKFFPSRSAPVD
jgi:hypothetical protein